MGEQATCSLSPGALHTSYELSPHDNILIVSLDKDAWTDQSCVLFTETLCLYKTLLSYRSRSLHLLLRTCCLELGCFSIFLGHSICFLVIFRILFKCCKGQKIIEKGWSVESNGQPWNVSISGNAERTLFAGIGRWINHITHFLPPQLMCPPAERYWLFRVQKNFICNKSHIDNVWNKPTRWTWNMRWTLWPDGITRNKSPTGFSTRKTIQWMNKCFKRFK